MNVSRNTVKTLQAEAGSGRPGALFAGYVLELLEADNVEH